MRINYGGTAFPVPGLHNDESFNGMTLRDYFAAKAMGGFAADPNYSGSCEEMAEWSYKWADAMLTERDK